MSFRKAHFSNRLLDKKRRRIHKNKYAHLVPKKILTYIPRDKTFRQLPLEGEAGKVFPKGIKFIWHGRIYELLEDTVIPVVGFTSGNFVLVKPSSQ